MSPSKDVEWHEINFGSDIELKERKDTWKPTQALPLMSVLNDTAEDV
jgi:hypothetical protein